MEAGVGARGFFRECVAIPPDKQSLPHVCPVHLRIIPYFR